MHSTYFYHSKARVPLHLLFFYINKLSTVCIYAVFLGRKLHIILIQGFQNAVVILGHVKFASFEFQLTFLSKPTSIEKTFIGPWQIHRRITKVLTTLIFRYTEVFCYCINDFLFLFCSSKAYLKR